MSNKNDIVKLDNLQMPLPIDMNNPNFNVSVVSHGSFVPPPSPVKKPFTQIQSDKNKNYYMQLVTERVYKINESDYNTILNAFLYRNNTGGAVMEISERVIDFNIANKDDKSKPVYKINPVCTRFVVFDKIVFLFTEDKKGKK